MEQWTEQELEQLVKSLEVEFSAYIAEQSTATSPTTLVKAEEKEKEEETLPKDQPEEKMETEEKMSVSEDTQEPPKEEMKEEIKEEVKEEPKTQQSSAYSEEAMDILDKMYASMSKEELLVHHHSCVKALDSMGEEHKHPSESIEKCGEVTMMKSESKDQSGAELILAKSEIAATKSKLDLAKKEATDAKAKVEELQKTLHGVQEILTLMVKKVPQGKAITSMEQIAKSESKKVDITKLSKSEITQILYKKASDPTLSVSDRKAIDEYYLKKANLNTISHLLNT